MPFDDGQRLLQYKYIGVFFTVWKKCVYLYLYIFIFYVFTYIYISILNLYSKVNKVAKVLVFCCVILSMEHDNEHGRGGDLLAYTAQFGWDRQGLGQILVRNWPGFGCSLFQIFLEFWS
jgi:hypothetical protein